MTLQEEKDYRAILFSMSWAFVQIRNAKNFDEAKIIADIFHNCPSNIANKIEINAIEGKLIETSERHGYTKILRSILKYGKGIAENQSN